VTAEEDAMRKRDLDQAADPRTFSRYFQANWRKDKRAVHQHEVSPDTTRTDRYKGHLITIRTRYEIDIDGQPVKGHVDVGNDGMVQYHPLPNYSFMSAVDLVRTLIDTFPDDFKLRPTQRAKAKRRTGRRRTHRKGGH
jgi:hypothetical protein